MRRPTGGRKAEYVTKNRLGNALGIGTESGEMPEHDVCSKAGDETGRPDLEERERLKI